jgi:iron complex outermembrane receptor protein
VNLSYALDFGLAYVTYSQGFRSGGFNGRAGDADDVGPYRPEDVESWEVGFKADLMDERLRLNVAAFMIDYMDKQEDVVFPGGPNGTVTIVENASSASINGFEVEATAIVAEGFTLSLSLGLLDASYDEWLVPDTFNPGRVIDKSNFELRRAPEVTASIRALYEYELARGDFLVFSANYSWRDDYHLNANTVTYNDVTPGMQQFGMNESFGTLDLSINYEAEQWVLSLFGKNVLDERYYQNVFDVGTNYTTNSATDRTPVPIPGLWTFGSLNQPATWGAEVRYKF